MLDPFPYPESLVLSVSHQREGGDPGASSFWLHLEKASWEFPGDLVVSIPGFHCHGLGSVPGQGTEIP